MKRLTLPLIAYMFIVFACGIAVGAFAHRAVTAREVRAGRPRSPEEFRERYIELMRSRLKLTDVQVRQLQAALDHTRERFEALDEGVLRPQKQAIWEQQVAEINSFLTPEQQDGYAALRKEREERHRKERDRDRPGNGRRP